MTFKVFLGIHVEALRLWLERGASVHPGVAARPRRKLAERDERHDGNTSKKDDRRWRRCPLAGGSRLLRRRARARPGPGSGWPAMLHCGSLETPSAGRHHAGCSRGAQDGPHGVMQLRNGRVARRYLTGGSVGFAESFIEGDWDTPDLATLLALLSAQRACLGRRLFRRPLAALAAARRSICCGRTPAAAAAATSMPTTIWATSSSPHGSTRR